MKKAKCKQKSTDTYTVVSYKNFFFKSTGKSKESLCKSCLLLFSSLNREKNKSLFQAMLQNQGLQRRGGRSLHTTISKVQCVCKATGKNVFPSSPHVAKWEALKSFFKRSQKHSCFLEGCIKPTLRERSKDWGTERLEEDGNGRSIWIMAVVHTLSLMAQPMFSVQ